jgi:hypothetical protein
MTLEDLRRHDGDSNTRTVLATVSARLTLKSPRMAAARGTHAPAGLAV